MFTAAKARNMLSCSEAILEDVVSVLSINFLLDFHNIILWVNKPLTSHEKVTGSVRLCFYWIKESKEINLCGTRLRSCSTETQRLLL